MKDQHIEKNTIIQFNKWAQTYDSNPFTYYNFYSLNQSIRKLLAPKRGSSILDVGFGTGILLEQLSKTDKCLKLCGIDISDEMVKKAKQKFIDNKQVQLYLGSATILPFKNNSFEYVTCVQSFHHHPDSLQSLKEMYRVLKPKGKLFLVDTSLDGLIRIFIHKAEQFLFSERERDIFRYTKQQMKNLFKKAGFKNIKQQYLQYTSLITIGEK